MKTKTVVIWRQGVANRLHSCILQRSMRRIGIGCGVLHSRMILTVCFIPIPFLGRSGSTGGRGGEVKER